MLHFFVVVRMWASITPLGVKRFIGISDYFVFRIFLNCFRVNIVAYGTLEVELSSATCFLPLDSSKS